MRAVGYVRVSTTKQADEGVSLAAQEAKVRAYCDLYGYELVDVQVDAGASASTLDRPGMAEALRMLDDGEADALVVVKLDRLTRSVRDLDTLLHRYFRDDTGAALVSVSEQVDTTNATGRMILNVLMSVSQWEREVIGERTAAAMAEKAARGEYTGGAVPFGFELAPDGVRLRPCPAEQEILAEIRALRDDGLSLRAVADALNARGALRRDGKRWHKVAVHRVLKAA